LGADFFVVGFFAVVEALAEAAFLAAPGLAIRDDLERAGDFFPTAASGAGEARGDGRGEDIAWDDVSANGIRTMVMAGRVGKSLARIKTTRLRLYIRRTEPSASHHV
jgi:hypothetical protein